MLGRRTFLLTIAALGACSRPGRIRSLRLAAGEPVGMYYRFGQLLADASEGYRIRVEAIQTDGSWQNVQLLLAGRAELALSHADVAPTDGSVLAIGRVYENYVQVVVRDDDTGPSSVTGLRGRRVVLGAKGSGIAEVTGPRLLAAAGLDPGSDLDATHLRLLEALAQLRDHRVDAFVWGSGFPTPALSVSGVRYLPLTPAIAPLQRAHPGLYDHVRLPGTEIETVGVANLLLARPQLPGTDAAELVEVLVTRASELIPEHALGTQFLDLRSLIGTGPVPLHPGAVEAYTRLHG